MTRTFPAHKRSLKPADWPEPHRAAWAAATAPGDPLNRPRSNVSRCRPITLRNRESGYGRWLTWLKLCGELDPAADPASLATRERVKAYWLSLESESLSGHTVCGRLMSLSVVLAAMCPDEDFKWIARAAQRVGATATPVRSYEARLRPPEEILALAHDLMWAAETGEFRSERKRAVLYRDGLLIALLAHRALRVRNLAGIEIGKHLRRREGGWWLSFDAADSKTHRGFSCPWPDVLTGALEDYLATYRPKLLSGSAHVTDALWPTMTGKSRMRPDDVAHAIRSRTAARFGIGINPHAFRAITATTIATDNPEGVAGIAAVLTHRGLRTSEAHYNKARQSTAARDYQDTVRGLRRGTPGRTEARAEKSSEPRARPCDEFLPPRPRRGSPRPAP